MNIDSIKKMMIETLDIKKPQNKARIDIVFVSFAFLISAYLNWEIRDISALCFTVWVILNPIPSRLMAKSALFFLVMTPILFVLKKESYAEQVAILAYYSLILSVGLSIFEYTKQNKYK